MQVPARDRMKGCGAIAAAVACVLGGPAWADASAGSGPPGCEAVALSRPAAGEVLTQSPPTLEWLAVPGRRDRLQVAVVGAQARSVVMHDLDIDGGRWTLPASPAPALLAVKVLVSRGCPQLQADDLHSLPAAFFVDSREACAIAPGSLVPLADGARWAPVPLAQGYRVRVFRGQPEDGQALALRHQGEVTAPHLRLAGRDAPAPADVLVVQALCGGAPGPAAAAVIGG